MREVFSNVALFLPFLDLFAALCGNGMLESMLEPHLKHAGASAIDVGISFLAFGCCYMIGNLIFGVVSSICKLIKQVLLLYYLLNYFSSLISLVTQ